MSETSNSSGDHQDGHLENKNDDQLQKNSSGFVKEEIKKSSGIDNLDDYLIDLMNRVDSHETEVRAKIDENSEMIENLKSEVKRLEKEIERREWLKPSIIVSIGLAIIGLSLGAFYHFNVRIDNVGGRIDTIYYYQSRPLETEAMGGATEEMLMRQGE